MAHFAGLVAGKVFTGDFDPVPHAHVTTTTTHKSLRGPRGGMVLCQPEFADSVDRGCPMVLGGPLGARDGGEGGRAGRGPAAGVRGRTRRPSPTTRSALAEGLLKRGARLVTGGTENHLVLLDVSIVRAHRPAGRVGAARLRHRHQPQLDPARPERRLVHLGRAARHAGAHLAWFRRRRLRRGRRADRRRAGRDRRLPRRRTGRRPRPATRSPTAWPRTPRPPPWNCSAPIRSTPASTSASRRRRNTPARQSAVAPPASSESPAGSSLWPPNCWRIADSSWSAKWSSPREANRSNSGGGQHRRRHARCRSRP